MTPAQVYRAALRLADALDVVADEMGREDACQEIITAHAHAAEEMCWFLDAADDGPEGVPTVAHIAIALVSDHGPSLSDLTRWANAWRSWGESLRASLQACPVSPFGAGCTRGVGETFPFTRLHNHACPVHGGNHG